MEKVIAVVVSYNRQVLLSGCIQALRNQTRPPDAILVVNNGSTDNTEHWLKQQPGIFHVTQENVGSGGGFNTGIEWAFKKGYNWIWCMDDDGYPKEDALEMLLNTETPNRSLLNCAVLNRNDKQTFVWNTGNFKTIHDVDTDLVAGIGHPFNGTLIHRSIVEKVGLPKASLFLWGDETEYYYRIVRKHQIPVYTVTKSIHYHPPTAYSYKQDWDFATGWKMYFYVRNRFHIHRAKFSNKILAIINFCFFVVAFAGIIMIFQKTNKVKKVGFMLWPIADAIKNDFSATPPTILKRLKEAERRSFQIPFIAPIVSIWQLLFAHEPAVSRKTATA
jgi:rhamnopyranosyl-N-acetylglucosaminyl-diphospho-decaprenol beta-1,3/1,4-galactofuranosyltransferase